MKFSSDWKKRLAIAGYRRGEKTRDRVLMFVASHSQHTDAEIASALDLSLRTVGGHIKKLRESGTITTETTRFSLSQGWVNQRVIDITKAGHDAVCESKIRLQGSPRPGPETPSPHPQDDEDLLRRGGFDTGAWWDVGGDRTPGGTPPADDYQRRRDGLPEPGF